MHPKAVDLQPFQTSIKPHFHWKKRFPSISLLLSRARIHRQALNEISNKSICQSALGKGSFPHKLELCLFPAVSLAAPHPTFGCSPSSTCLTRQRVLGIQREPTLPAWVPHAVFLQKLPISTVPVLSCIHITPSTAPAQLTCQMCSAQDHLQMMLKTNAQMLQVLTAYPKGALHFCPRKVVTMHRFWKMKQFSGLSVMSLHRVNITHGIGAQEFLDKKISEKPIFSK